MGGGRRNEKDKYFVLAKPRQRNAHAKPDAWRVAKGPHDRSFNTVETFDNKMDAEARAKELAKKNNTVVESFDAAKKSSRRFDYR